jgi:hypothetical protein
VALDVARATVPRYRTTFSKHQFTQPQLLAILCLMRCEGWTYREAEARPAEHSELCRALGLRSLPDYTSLYRFRRRLHKSAITHALNEVVRRIALPRARRRAHWTQHFPARGTVRVPHSYLPVVGGYLTFEYDGASVVRNTAVPPPAFKQIRDVKGRLTAKQDTAIARSRETLNTS